MDRHQARRLERDAMWTAPVSNRLERTRRRNARRRAWGVALAYLGPAFVVFALALWCAAIWSA